MKLKKVIHWIEAHNIPLYLMIVAAICFWLALEICQSERDTLRDSVQVLQEKVDSLGSLALQANEQWRECLNNRDKYIGAYRSVALNCAEELRFFRPESTQVIDGVLLERSKSAGTAWNDGVLYVDSITLIQVKDVGIIKGELMDSTRLDSLYQEWIEKPLQKWIDEH